MRLRVSALAAFFAAGLSAAPRFSFHVLGNEAGGWGELLSSIGMTRGSPAAAGVFVAPQGTAGPASELSARVEQGAILVLEGESPLAAAFGFRPSAEPHLIVQSVEDLRMPALRIIWEKALDLPVFRVPSSARVFARERWRKAPLMAGYSSGAGAVLWVAAPPGPHGYERFPYIPQALTDLGLEPPFRSARLWAFFDSAYRLRADPDYLAARWRTAGIGALHVAAWHYWERDSESDAYLRSLIEACHRNAILVYAWFELPHVSEKFWDQHPEWREKTALRQDAQLDWRKLINLTNRSAFAAVSGGVRDLVAGFDWDGVNLAELYFESLEGVDNPARLTPMNDDVRAEFRQQAGLDPLALFDANSLQQWTKNPQGLKQFLDFRAELARRQQAEWIAQIELIRKSKPHLDLALTHIDDRFDPSMREKLGADTSRVLPMLGQHDFTFLIEDPATIWNLGPQRYPQIAARYSGLAAPQEKLAIDVNIVERYQDVYPTKQQTGSELFALVHIAASAFPRVALYFENSILTPDLPLLASAAATVSRVEQASGGLLVRSSRGVGVPWKGPALVDGKLWPMTDGATVWLPPGAHSIEAAAQVPALRVLHFNGDLKSASATNGGLDLIYQSSARAIALLDRTPKSLAIDGVPSIPQMLGNGLLLPKGQHLVSIQ